MSYPDASLGAIITDIEGTVTSIAFVKEVLFPYARAHLPGFVAAREQDPEIAALLAEARALAGAPDLDTGGTVALLLSWIEADRKATPLKTLQGMIWREGYERGAIESDIYPDAVRALRRWHDAGLGLYVYSSGSVEAQELIFRHSRQGDLTGLFSGYFDTLVGGKLEARSYARIAERVGLAPGRFLFLSDSPGELDAARAAGLHTLGVDRGEMAGSAPHAHASVATFDDIGRHYALP